MHTPIFPVPIAGGTVRFLGENGLSGALLSNGWYILRRAEDFFKSPHKADVQVSLRPVKLADGRELYEVCLWENGNRCVVESGVRMFHEGVLYAANLFKSREAARMLGAAEQE